VRISKPALPSRQGVAEQHDLCARINALLDGGPEIEVQLVLHPLVDTKEGSRDVAGQRCPDRRESCAPSLAARVMGSESNDGTSYEND
jgi:hypothetical protein